jgi:hypothetical protein
VTQATLHRRTAARDAAEVRQWRGLGLPHPVGDRPLGPDTGWADRLPGTGTGRRPRRARRRRHHGDDRPPARPGPVQRYTLGRIEENKGCFKPNEARRETGEFDVDFVREGVRWLATRHATPDTQRHGRSLAGVRGAEDGREVRSIVGQPHIWDQGLSDVAALEPDPPADLEFDGDSIGGMLAALRDDTRPE